MKTNISICIIAILFLCGGCASSAKYLQPTSVCKPLSAFDTIVIAPFDSESTFVEESQYKHLPNAVALASTDKLKDQIQDNRIFSKVIKSSDCVDRAIKIDVKFNNLIHRKREFNLEYSGQIINCQNGERLYTFNSREWADESMRLPGLIVRALVNGIKAKLTCETQQ
jgi:hypothetical protein